MTKPGDHPEFFRLPAPPGRSRESTIVLDREGRFWHDGELVAHPGMQLAFATWISRHPDDGRFILENGYDWTYFSVEDVPFFIRSLRVDEAGAHVLLSDDSEELLDLDSVRTGEGSALYARVKGGAYEARFLQQAQAALTPLLVETDGGFGLEHQGKVHSIQIRKGP